MIDRVLSCEPGKAIRAIKNVTVNEPYFLGHFPHRPVMPGVMILEAMAQATGVLAFITTGGAPGRDTLYYFVGVDKARFKKPVEPGDQLDMHIEIVRSMRQVWKFNASARVDEHVVAEAEIMCAARKFTDD